MASPASCCRHTVRISELWIRHQRWSFSALHSSPHTRVLLRCLPLVRRSSLALAVGATPRTGEPHHFPQSVPLWSIGVPPGCRPSLASSLLGRGTPLAAPRRRPPDGSDRRQCPRCVVVNGFVCRPRVNYRLVPFEAKASPRSPPGGLTTARAGPGVPSCRAGAVCLTAVPSTAHHPGSRSCRLQQLLFLTRARPV